MTLERKLKHAIKSNDINKIHIVFDEIYRLYGRLVYFKIMQYIDNKLDVEDLTQDVFVSFYNNIKYIEVLNIKYYLVVSAKNKALNYLKKKKEIVINDEKTVLEKEDVIKSNIEYEEIMAKMKCFLNNFEIEIIIKHNIDGYSFKELSIEYNKPLNTIISIYHRGIKKIKKGCEQND